MITVQLMDSLQCTIGQGMALVMDGQELPLSSGTVRLQKSHAKARGCQARTGASDASVPRLTDVRIQMA